ncbi:MAG: hypothetical protein QOJ35_368 [Solirubrobacteraceae bacterium]|jgi:uncharacterized protein YndB with AHSA1/START domain|nr:hypothetical protein [Solirubrobacteraceae bacterium]
MQPATAAVRIRRPRVAVHALLCDLSRRPAYLDHFLVDWTPVGDDQRAAGAAWRLRAKGGGGHDAIDLVVTEVTPERIVEEARGGRGMRRHMRLTYALSDVSRGATQVTFTLELLAGSLVDRATWNVTRSHLERQYAQAMLRLKGLLEGERP